MPGEQTSHPPFFPSLRRLLQLAGRLNRLPVSYLEECHSGDFLSVINADLAWLKRLTGKEYL